MKMILKRNNEEQCFLMIGMPLCESQVIMYALVFYDTQAPLKLKVNLNS